jgi:hypothetical protein
MKLKRKEFADLKKGGMTVNEYLNSFIQLSRYAPDDINTYEKKKDVFLSGLNDHIQFQLLNTDYADFRHMIDKAIVIENKIREMEKDGKRKVSFSRQSSRSNIRPRFTQPNQLFKPLQMNRTPMPVQAPRSQFPDAEASTATTSTQWAATISPEHAVRPLLQCPNHARCITSRQPYWWSLFQVWLD